MLASLRKGGPVNVAIGEMGGSLGLCPAKESFGCLELDFKLSYVRPEAFTVARVHQTILECGIEEEKGSEASKALSYFPVLAGVSEFG